MAADLMTYVHVKLFADLQQFIGGAPSINVEISSGETVASVIEQLGVPHDRVKIIFLNARFTPLEHPLQGGEQLSIFSAVGGG